jgi:hypothetical protein
MRPRDSLVAPVAVAVAFVTAGVVLLLLVAAAKTNGYENIAIVASVVFVATFSAVLAMSGRLRLAAGLSGLLTCLTVGGGFAIIYAFFAHVCGAHPSSC